MALFEKKLKTKIKNQVFDLKQVLSLANVAYTNLSGESEQIYNETVRKAEQDYQGSLKENKVRHLPTYASVNDYFGELGKQDDFSVMGWEDTRWNNFIPVSETGYFIPDATYIGDIVSKESDPEFGEIFAPALIPIIGYNNLMIKMPLSNEHYATSALQSINLRLLATMPAGKLKTTLIDPTGQGRSMGGLVDLPEEILVGGQSWNNSEDIEQKLKAISAHIELVQHKYLGGGVRFNTIDDYNRNDNRIEEPYQLLVIADFPHKFSDSAVQTLVDIARNGPFSGVYILATIDTSAKLPYEFNLATLEQFGTIINIVSNHYVLQEPSFDQFYLNPDEPPESNRFSSLVKQIGGVAEEVSQIKILFDEFSPRKLWQKTSRQGLQVPIGQPIGRPKDVNRENEECYKYQCFELINTSEKMVSHALIAGKTGMGKSKLLHAIIVSLALQYSPEELQLYLLDFKGVEFFPYATHKLPHAKVVVAQGDREFGLSVLTELKEEFNQRDKKIRAAHCQDIFAYRQKTNKPMPRIVLIIDEFQTLFEDDDELASQAKSILEVLARKARAYGIHIMLASQSLKGTASYIRQGSAILEQMGLRIVLSLDEDDSYMVLGDNNPEAGLLSRPGEAIYNDQNGRIEANQRFQVALLMGDELDRYIQRLANEADLVNYKTSQIVFRGDKPANIEINEQLLPLLNTTEWPTEQSDTAYAWLGEPIAIKSHTVAVLRPQSRANMFVMGQNEEAALAILFSTFVSLAAQYHPEDARFVILDPPRRNAELDKLMSNLWGSIPHKTKICRRKREINQAIQEIAKEVENREDLDDYNHPKNIYLIVSGLHRIRDLRQDDAYFIPDTDAPPKVTQLFTDIIREGPEGGVHAIIWCNTSASLTRSSVRNTEEFDFKVALQMTPNDSSSFLQSEVASKLGDNRAYFTDEEQMMGQVEKFRPYELPTQEWIVNFANNFNQRND